MIDWRAGEQETKRCKDSNVKNQETHDAVSSFVVCKMGQTQINFATGFPIPPLMMHCRRSKLCAWLLTAASQLPMLKARLKCAVRSAITELMFLTKPTIGEATNAKADAKQGKG